LRPTFAKFKTLSLKHKDNNMHKLSPLFDRGYDMEEIKKRLTQRNLYEPDPIAPWENDL
jgi:hypothetical protein